MQKRIRDPYLDDKKLKRSSLPKDTHPRNDNKKYDDFGRLNKKLYTSNYNCNTVENLENKKNFKEKKSDTEIHLSDESEADQIKKLFGIEDFDSSKNKDHSSSSRSYANIRSRRKYRQYMNRPGGFNRPLSPSK
ncbi:hypothetical protein RS030_172675 [Cryptosporidium xiaoi]|uniref:U4/U6.U5 small nuclear ribonucleoprotein 27kDa protein domain-containing protein n=1 Tax=Cryptosporidium xiaoi TaxID=659607 RepID=A0AAV9Y5N1_9CRYT